MTIEGNVVMFSGCMDSQTSADVGNTKSVFSLPTSAGPGGAGGACTNALLETLHENGTNITYETLLKKMQTLLAQKKFTQVPQLSSTEHFAPATQPLQLIQPNGSGKTRALLVGINYTGKTVEGQSLELFGCCNDVHKMKRFLSEQGFDTTEAHMKVLMDEGDNELPTMDNILKGFKWLVKGAAAGDSLFLHYSGHGGNVRDEDGDEHDGRDETLIPLDFGDHYKQITDDVILKEVVCNIPKGCQLICVMDCCHSGTILDLPWVYAPDGNSSQDGKVSLLENPSFDPARIETLQQTMLAAMQVIQSGDKLQIIAFVEAIARKVLQMVGAPAWIAGTLINFLKNKIGV